MNLVSKTIALSLSTLLITACGGGGGESSGSGSNGGSANTGSVANLPATSHDRLASSGHDTGNLNFNTNIIVNSQDNSVHAVTKIYNYDNHLTGLRVDHSDSIAIFADGKPVEIKEDFSTDLNANYSYSYTLPSNASSYEFRYTRNGELVSEGSLDSLPQAFGVAGDINGDDISISLYKNANHTYEYLVETLVCQENVGDITAIVQSIYPEDGEGILTGDYNKKFSSLFYTDIDSLKSEFGICTIEVEFSSKSERLIKCFPTKTFQYSPFRLKPQK